MGLSSCEKQAVKA